jgi:flavin reductase (DIM6/NTAB) family NADH-FMN oxidoreductase RutF
MSLKPIPFEAFRVKTYHIWDKQWLLVTSGDFAAGHFNTMTVGWGSFGTMWGHPFVQVVIRPTRYTYEFMEQYPTFTLCAFPITYKSALDLLGSRSGRNGNKIAAAGLTPVAATVVAAPAFAEAELVVECRKIYWDDLNPAHFVDPRIEDNYPRKDYHRIYYGQIVAISGDERYGA